jgi:hypothetical protein
MFPRAQGSVVLVEPTGRSATPGRVIVTLGQERGPVSAKPTVDAEAELSTRHALFGRIVVVLFSPPCQVV